MFRWWTASPPAESFNVELDRSIASMPSLPEFAASTHSWGEAFVCVCVCVCQSGVCVCMCVLARG